MNHEEELRDLCNLLLRIEDREWKPMRVFRSETQAMKDEARHELAMEIADEARSILQRMTPNPSFQGTPHETTKGD